jgi:Ca2+/Na+ antiporter
MLKTLSFTKRLKLFLVLPTRIIGFLFIPDFRRFKNCKEYILVLTIIFSLFLIGICSYIIVWMALVICETLNISETIIGFGALSAATSMEETITSISICKREINRMKKQTSQSSQKSKLNMALSNAIGSNIFDISIGLGFPYLLNSLFFSQSKYFTKVYSGNIAFMLFGLIICLALYLILLKLFNWKLTRCFGISLTFIWIIYTVLVICLEMNLIKFDFFNFYFIKCK